MDACAEVFSTEPLNLLPVFRVGFFVANSCGKCSIGPAALRRFASDSGGVEMEMEGKIYTVWGPQ